MDKGAYEIIKMLIQNVDQKIELVFVDGGRRTLSIDSEKLLAELDKDQKLEKEADWLAQRLVNKDQSLRMGGFIQDYYTSITEWREAARKAIERDNQDDKLQDKGGDI